MTLSAAEVRDLAFARLCDHARVGAFVGILLDGADRTLAANAQLRLIFGYPLEIDDASIFPFGLERFIDPLARPNLVDRLRRDGSVADFLVRVRRMDLTPIWVEITGWAEAAPGEASMNTRNAVADIRRFMPAAPGLSSAGRPRARHWGTGPRMTRRHRTSRP